MTIDFLTLTETFERVISPRLAFRPVSPSDAWPLFQATRNPLFNQGLLWDQPETEAQVVDRIDGIVAAARRGRLTALSAVVKATGEWVALFRFQPYVANPAASLEMGIWTHDKFWCGRYSLELVRACIDAAFQLSNISSLVGAASPMNRSSCKLMELCGMERTQLVHRQRETTSEVELQEFAITRESWARARSGPAHHYVAMREVVHASSAMLHLQSERYMPTEPAVFAPPVHTQAVDGAAHSVATKRTPSPRAGASGGLRQRPTPPVAQLALPFSS